MKEPETADGGKEKTNRCFSALKQPTRSVLIFLSFLNLLKFVSDQPYNVCKRFLSVSVSGKEKLKLSERFHHLLLFIISAQTFLLRCFQPHEANV